MIRAVFVYGTLKQGQCRCGLWPVEPVTIQPAWTRGTLMARSDYPAMVVGQDRVLGECWRFRDTDMGRVLRTLDQIEGTNQPGAKDLYLKVVVDSWSLGDELLGDAYTYQYASDPIRDGFVKLEPGGESPFVRWPS